LLIDVLILKKYFINIYLTAIFLFSASFGFRFFVDSNTYFDGYNDMFMMVMVFFYPLMSIVFAIVNLLFVRKVLLSDGVVAWLIFSNPYYLLLMTNLTKEQLIFFGIFVFYGLKLYIKSCNESRLYRVLRFPAVSFLAVRPIYFVYIFINLIFKSAKIKYLLPPLILLFVLIVLVFGYFGYGYSNINDYFLLRSQIDHTGREFFVDLCSFYRDDLLLFPFCAMSSVLGFPIHSDVFSINYIILVLHVIPLWCYFLFNFKKKVTLLKFTILLLFALVVFWWSPSFGAYLRYFAPVIWIFYFLNSSKVNFAFK
jgi:hypothetical protein